MLAKTMRIGSKRTSIKLEDKFWKCLKEIAYDRHTSLSTIVNEVATGTRDSNNLASTLRTFTLTHLLNQVSILQGRSCEQAWANKTDLLLDMIRSWPTPAIVIDSKRCIIVSNDAFVNWIRVDGKSIYGEQIDRLMSLGRDDISDLWARISNGQLQHATCEAALVAVDGVRRTQAMIIALHGYNAYLGRRPLSAIMLAMPTHGMLWQPICDS